MSDPLRSPWIITILVVAAMFLGATDAGHRLVNSVVGYRLLEDRDAKMEDLQRKLDLLETNQSQSQQGTGYYSSSSSTQAGPSQRNDGRSPVEDMLENQRQREINNLLRERDQQEMMKTFQPRDGR